MEERHIITVKTDGLEKSAALLANIIGKADFSRKLRMVVEYDPELPNAEIRISGPRGGGRNELAG